MHPGDLSAMGWFSCFAPVFSQYVARMSDDESVRPAAEPTPAEPTSLAKVAPVAEPSSAEPAPAAEPGPAEPAQPDASPAGASPAAEQAKAPGRAVTFLKDHAVTLVLAVLLVAAIVWGALGMTSAASWESRAASLSADLTGTEKTLADAKATIDDLETAKSRAESTATACIGAIDDADAMLEVSAKIDEKTVVYLEGLNDFIAAVNARDVAAVETISAEMDKLSVQLDDLSAEIEEHIENYGESAEGCHVDDAQGV
jgi:hypothetical protein